jgi:hypothetical protein
MPRRFFRPNDGAALAQCSDLFVSPTWRHARMKTQDQTQDTARPLARQVARELTNAEIDAIAGGRPYTTHATGPNGDDPADPGDLK